MDPRDALLIHLTDPLSLKEALKLIDKLEGRVNQVLIGGDLREMMHEPAPNDIDLVSNDADKIAKHARQAGMRAISNRFIGGDTLDIRSFMRDLPGSFDGFTARSILGRKGMGIVARKRDELDLFVVLTSARRSRRVPKKIDFSDPAFARSWRRRRRSVVWRAARLAKDLGANGIICEAGDLECLKAFELREDHNCHLARVVTDIEPAWYALRDLTEKRISSTPTEALERGANVLILDRAITEHRKPRDAADRVLEEILLCHQKARKRAEERFGRSP